ncbi:MULTISPECIES: hypothetical protein [unclassified Blastococcus]
MTDEQLAAVRCYTSAEVVQMLNMKKKWLKDLVRDRRVPHQRTGATKGVWFTAEVVSKIGEMLPELMSRRQMNTEAGLRGRRAARRHGNGDGAGRGLGSEGGERAQLAAHQRRPDRPTV